VERMGRHYLAHQICALEAMVLNARGHDADDVWARALDLAHDVKDPQALGPTLSYRARALLDSGRPENVPTLVDEVLTFTDEQGRALYYTWLIELAWLLVDLGRGDEMPSADSGGIWLRTAELVVAHDFAAA